MKKIFRSLALGAMCVTLAASACVGSMVFAEDVQTATTGDVQTALPTMEEYEAILAQFNEEHGTDLAIDWDSVDEISSGREPFTPSECEDKPITEMTAEEFTACLEKSAACLAKTTAGIEEENPNICKVEDVQSEELPTIEEYEAILAQFNEEHDTKLAIDWYEATDPDREDFTPSECEDKPITEMTAEEFTACLEKSAAAIEKYKAEEDNPNIVPNTGEDVQPIDLTTLTTQKWYYWTADNPDGYMKNYLYCDFYWIAADGANYYSTFDKYGSVVADYPGYIAYQCNPAFNSNRTSVRCNFEAYLYSGPSVHSSQSYKMSVVFDVNKGDVYD